MDEDTIYLYSEKQGDLLMEVLEEWGTYKKKNLPTSTELQPWKLIPKEKIVKEWAFIATNGICHDEIVDEFAEIVIENTIKMYINTVLFGHTPMSPYGFAECFINEDTTEDEFETFLEDMEYWACDEDGNWRISDYGMDKLESCAIHLLESTDGMDKVYWIDTALSVTHQRSNLSKSFITGGSIGLDELFNQ